MVADCVYGDNPGFTDALGAARVPFVLALKPRKGTWAPADGPTPRSRRPATRLARPRRARAVAAGDPPLPRRPHRDLVGGRRPAGRLGTGPAAAAGGGHHRPGRCPGTAPGIWRPTCPDRRARRAQPADLAEIVRLYGLRNWVEQGYKQVKGELGWADFQVRTDRAIRRHWTLVCCAFCFCWQAFLAEHPPTSTARLPGRPVGRAGGKGDRASTPNQPSAARGRWRCGRCGPG